VFGVSGKFGRTARKEMLQETRLGFDVASGLFSRAVLDTVHLAFVIWGIFAWRKDGTRSSE